MRRILLVAIRALAVFFARVCDGSLRVLFGILRNPRSLAALSRAHRAILVCAVPEPALFCRILVLHRWRVLYCAFWAILRLRGAQKPLVFAMRNLRLYAAPNAFRLRALFALLCPRDSAHARLCRVLPSLYHAPSRWNRRLVRFAILGIPRCLSPRTQPPDPARTLRRLGAFVVARNRAQKAVCATQSILHSRFFVEFNSFLAEMR